MAGFKKENKENDDIDTKLDVDIDDVDLSIKSTDSIDYEDDDDDDDDDFEEKYRRNKERESKKSGNKKAMIIGIVAIACVVGIGSYSYVSNKKAKEQIAQAEEQARQALESNKEDVTVGVPNMYNSSNYEGTTNEEAVSSSQDFLKDLNEKPVETNYKIASIETVRDYVDYEKKRAIMDDGMEIYWLDLTYKGKKYRMQVPLSLFQSLTSEKHITLVDIELTTLDNGSQLITYMSMVKNANTLINPGY